MAHGGDLLARELARFHVRSQHGGQQTRLVVQLGGEGALMATVLGALLHGGQNAGLLALRDATESDGCGMGSGDGNGRIRKSFADEREEFTRAQTS